MSGSAKPAVHVCAAERGGLLASCLLAIRWLAAASSADVHLLQESAAGTLSDAGSRKELLATVHNEPSLLAPEGDHVMERVAAAAPSLRPRMCWNTILRKVCLNSRMR